MVTEWLSKFPGQETEDFIAYSVSGGYHLREMAGMITTVIIVRVQTTHLNLQIDM